MSTETETKLVKTYVNATTKARLEALAAKEERSVAFIIRRMIREGLVREEIAAATETA
jgi:predicted transcriptional regulator